MREEHIAVITELVEKDINNPIVKAILAAIQKQFPAATLDRLKFVHSEGRTYIYPIYDGAFEE